MNGPFTRDEFLTHLDSEKTFAEAMGKQAREMDLEQGLKTLDRESRTTTLANLHAHHTALAARVRRLRDHQRQSMSPYCAIDTTRALFPSA